MNETFKKGQMIPKRLGFVITHRKTQCNVVFGCDVEIDGRTVCAITEPQSGVVIMNTWKGRKRNNGTFQRIQYRFHDMEINANGAIAATYRGQAKHVKS